MKVMGLLIKKMSLNKFVRLILKMNMMENELFNHYFQVHRFAIGIGCIENIDSFSIFG